MRNIFFAILLASIFLMTAASVDAASLKNKRFRYQILAVRTDCGNLDVDAGGDETVDEDETVKLNASVDGDYDRLNWDCSGGKLTDDNALRPTWNPPSNYDNRDYQKTYTCTLTARNDCDTDSDSVKITVNYENGSEDLKVVLSAKPKTACAPSNNVDLTAKLEEHPRRDFEYTYKFDCDNDGDWERTVETEDTEYTAQDLCDYRRAGSYTARVRVEGRNNTVSDTIIVRADDCNGGGAGDRQDERTGRVSITKTVRNVSRGTNYQGIVAASPSEILSFKIAITAVSGDSDNVFVRDALPSGLIATGGLQIDNIGAGGNLSSGVDIGDLTAGQTKTVTYNAVVAAKENFMFGNTALTNTATVTAGGSSASSYITVNVYRSSVAGATAVPTGVSGDAFPAAAAGVAIFIFAALSLVRTKSAKYISRTIR